MSFKDVLNEQREILRKSNRANLANAYLKVEEREAELREQLEKLAALKLEIEAAGDESEWIDQNSATKIRKLYDQAENYRR